MNYPDFHRALFELMEMHNFGIGPELLNQNKAEVSQRFEDLGRDPALRLADGIRIQSPDFSDERDEKGTMLIQATCNKEFGAVFPHNSAAKNLLFGFKALQEALGPKYADYPVIHNIMCETEWNEGLVIETKLEYLPLLLELCEIGIARESRPLGPQEKTAEQQTEMDAKTKEMVTLLQRAFPAIARRHQQQQGKDHPNER